MLSQEEKYKKTGGWLVLVGIGLIIYPFKNAFDISQTLLLFFEPAWSAILKAGSQSHSPLLVPDIIFEFVMQLFFLYLKLF